MISVVDEVYRGIERVCMARAREHFISSSLMWATVEDVESAIPSLIVVSLEEEVVKNDITHKS